MYKIIKGEVRKVRKGGSGEREIFFLFFFVFFLFFFVVFLATASTRAQVSNHTS